MPAALSGAASSLAIVSTVAPPVPAAARSGTPVARPGPAFHIA
ncbi:hypothetical protein [Burkholderia sp. WAC0059]|nr:hypothetical protein [Burkholderia sp. WAC0059]